MLNNSKFSDKYQCNTSKVAEGRGACASESEKVLGQVTKKLFPKKWIFDNFQIFKVDFLGIGSDDLHFLRYPWKGLQEPYILIAFADFFRAGARRKRQKNNSHVARRPSIPCSWKRTFAAAWKTPSQAPGRHFKNFSKLSFHKVIAFSKFVIFLKLKSPSKDL